jgi:threonyl-tRNA synthetase
MVIIGEREEKIFKEEKKYMVKVRTREGKDLGLVDVIEFISDLKEKIGNFS